MAKEFDLGSKTDPRDVNDIPVSLLNQINKLEAQIQQLISGVAWVQQAFMQEVGGNLDGRLSMISQNTHRLAVNNSGEIYALVKVLTDRELTTEDELVEIKRVEFDEPLAKMQQEAEEKLARELEEERRAAAARDLGIVTPMGAETKIIKDTKI